MRMDKAPSFLVPTVSLLLAGGCEHAPQPIPTTPSPSSHQARTVTPSFHLTPAQRASVRPEFDVDALERLLRMLPEARRARVLGCFQKDEDPSRGFLVSLGDPALDAVLEEVWAPYWRQAPDEALTQDGDPIPGKRIERARRAAE